MEQLELDFNKKLTIEEVASIIHYPDCWDTATYPTLRDALEEIGCSPCKY